jgi:hypothetical protein
MLRFALFPNEKVDFEVQKKPSCITSHKHQLCSRTCITLTRIMKTHQNPVILIIMDAPVLLLQCVSQQASPKTEAQTDVHPGNIGTRVSVCNFCGTLHQADQEIGELSSTCSIVIHTLPLFISHPHMLQIVN